MEHTEMQLFLSFNNFKRRIKVYKCIDYEFKILLQMYFVKM